MIIRELTHEELLIAVELNYNCWNDDFAGIIPYDSMKIEKELTFVSNWINDKRCQDIRRIYGAFDGDKFLGYVGGSLAKKEDAEHGVELNYLYVKKEYRGMALGLKLIRTIIVEFEDYGVNKLIINNFHESESSKFYKYLGGEVVKQVIQTVKGKEVLVDVFSWNIDNLIEQLKDKLNSRSYEKGGLAFNDKLTEGISMTNTHTKEDLDVVLKGIFEHNTKGTNGLLKKPAIDINIYLKDGEKTIGAILCDTFNFCIYIEIMWIDKDYRGKGLGKKLISKAEKIAKENGCILSHTCSLSYQAPEFYQACGYEIFGKLDDYPNGIVQYFLKKKL
ncbi:GNAT family N-acetyltransferase [Clostridium senegalense]|uniref:GNAT family N-acetyltransferase n=1 Tax=Clostridium senegalense TaxID=1465809 RepID=UPI00028860DB|nr:GNAT family N-acetyltransferase [Clostridium senegalense]